MGQLSDRRWPDGYPMTDDQVQPAATTIQNFINRQPKNRSMLADLLSNASTLYRTLLKEQLPDISTLLVDVSTLQQASHWRFIFIGEVDIGTIT
ncbi:hypothetical protein RAB80_016949, partial [Fusarium oxysporum f. sp. vasinfectum]